MRFDIKEKPKPVEKPSTPYKVKVKRDKPDDALEAQMLNGGKFYGD